MGGFFIPGIGAGGGGGGNLPANVITGVQLNPVNNGLIFTYNTGATTDIPLNDVVENLTADQIKDVRLNGKTLVVEQVDGQQTTIALTNVLDAVDINFTPTPDIQSTDVQGAIVEVNDKVGDAYNDSEYDEVNGKLILKKPNGQEDEYRLAGLDRDNVFLGHNTFNEAFLLGKTPFIQTVGNVQNTGHNVNVHCGFREISTHFGQQAPLTPKYVSAIKIAICDAEVGDVVDGVYITEIKKVNNRQDDIVGNKIVSNSSFIVEEDNEYQKCIYVPIQKSYDEDTYFLIGKVGGKVLNETWYRDSSKYTEFINGYPINQLPQTGDTLKSDRGIGYVVMHSLVEDDINIREELSKIGNCDIVSAQIVGKELILTKQNGSTFSIDLTPVLKANNVSFDNATSGLQATTVQGAIDEIDGKVNNAYIDANFDDVSGDLTLIKPNGQNSVLSLSSLLFDVTFDDTNNTLNKVQNGVTTPVIDHVVTEWDDLEFVSKTKGDIRNIFNKHTQIQKDRYYTPVSGGGYEIHSNTSWDLAYIPVVPGQKITLIKNTHDSQNFGVYNEQRRHQQHIVVSGQLVNGVRVYRMTIDATLPQGDTYHLLINMHKAGNNPVDPNKVMVFNGDIANDDLPKEYIPYATHGSIFIDGSEVVHTFNPHGSTLVSQNTQDAIIELDRKITINSESAVKTVNNQMPDAQGNVQVEIGHITGLQNALDGKVNITQLSPISQPNKVPQLDQNGKLDTAMIPDLSINQVHSVANKQEALNLIANGTASIGHVFILRDDNNSVHMYVNQAGTGFDDKCVQLTMSNGSIVSVNQITGDATGNVTLNANQIRLEAKPTVTVEEELGKKVSTINSVAPNAQGNIDLELGVASDKLQLKVNNTEKSTLSLYTDAEANGLIAYFI